VVAKTEEIVEEPPKIEEIKDKKLGNETIKGDPDAPLTPILTDGARYLRNSIPLLGIGFGLSLPKLSLSRIGILSKESISWNLDPS
jgi:hypothetical protein